MTSTPTLLLREFQPGDQPAFERINAEWINRHFVLEPKDLLSLQQPETTILVHGGRIVFAVEHPDREKPEKEEVLGCCALCLLEPGVFEVAKMGVVESAHGRGIGRQLLSHVVAEARAGGATRLYLETNHTLAPALHLYHSLGFRAVPQERLIPSPYTRADTYLELFL